MIDLSRRSTLIAAVGGLTAPSIRASQNSQDPPLPADRTVTGSPSDFDFLIGDWNVRHRWTPEGAVFEGDGTWSTRRSLGDQGNYDEHWINKPTGAYHALGIRAFDARTRQWSIWWLDSRYLDYGFGTPLRGGFQGTRGLFYAVSEHEGRSTLARFIWDLADRDAPTWEQAVSSDNGETWIPNWFMRLSRKVD